MLCFLVALSAVVLKEHVSRRGSPVPAVSLAATEPVQHAPHVSTPDDYDLIARDWTADAPEPTSAPAADSATAAGTFIDDTSIRFFNGRPIRPARTMRMLVTAYSPDERSCPGTADGITASLHHVETNAHRSVAADKRILPFGSMLSVPGYDNGRVVPVLDVGGAIKGRRLDVLFRTHEQARRWGSRWLDVVVWEYADGKPAPDYRKVRDSKE